MDWSRLGHFLFIDFIEWLQSNFMRTPSHP